MNSFHSPSLFQRDGRISLSWHFGTDVTGFRAASYASCKSLKIRKRVVNTACFSEDGAQNARVARPRTVESLETTSPGTKLIIFFFFLNGREEKDITHEFISLRFFHEAVCILQLQQCK